MTEREKKNAPATSPRGTPIVGEPIDIDGDIINANWTRLNARLVDGRLPDGSELTPERARELLEEMRLEREVDIEMEGIGATILVFGPSDIPYLLERGLIPPSAVEVLERHFERSRKTVRLLPKKREGREEG